MTIRFDGKVAIVTGAGGGLGKQHALEFARRGAKVVVNDLGGAVDGSGGASDAANAVVEEIKAEGGEAMANGSSVADKEGVSKMVADTMEKWGRIDILVNNAGILKDKSFSFQTGLSGLEIIADTKLSPFIFVNTPLSSFSEVEFKSNDLSITETINNESLL